jgi:probable rRNA maturation factor
VTAPGTLRVFNRQRAVRLDLRGLVRIASAALPLCARAAQPGSPLGSLPVIEATILSDRRIAALHAAFFDDPSPTDVITFPHGEICVGAGTAAANAARFGHPVTHEAALCLVHGFMHLGGWDDGMPRTRRAMGIAQERIFKEALAMVGSGR